MVEQTPETAPQVPIIQGLSEIADHYDGFIVDLWGVMHDGVACFPPALACLEQIKAQGKAIAILSNAPRRSSAVIERNTELGIAEALCDYVLSSGEVAWQHLRTRGDDWYRRLGDRCYHIGPERDLPMRSGLSYDFVSTVAEADFVLMTGARSTVDQAEDYREPLTIALNRKLPMVCANPDLEVIRGGKREICAGALAVYYEEMGGEVRFHGKPHREVYDLCLLGLGLAPGSRLAMIGDSLRTDIAGAESAGMDGIFVAGGIHGELLGMDGHGGLVPERLQALCRTRRQYPTAAMAHLVW